MMNSMETPGAEAFQSQGVEEFRASVEMQLDDITTRPVGEDIDQYTEEALNDLTGLVTDVLDAYGRHSPLHGSLGSGVEEERAALAFFGLNPDTVESILDHLGYMGHLDVIIAEITEHTAAVIVPPDSRAPLVVPGGLKPFSPGALIPRLKTFLSCLKTNFGIDLRDRNQCRVIEGEVDPGMMREESYKVVLLPTLQRVVLICDEAENATFVFDSSVLAGLPDGPTFEQLMHMTKDRLKELIQTTPHVGYRLTYRGEHFVGHMSALMDAIPDSTTRTEDLSVDSRDEQPLDGYAAFPEGDDGSIIGTTRLADALGTTRRMVRQAVEALGDALGPLEVIDNKGSVRFSVAQQEAVLRYLVENGRIVPEAPEDFMSFTEMSQVFGVGARTLQRTIEACGQELGDLLDARRGVKRTKYYSTQQQIQILDRLIQDGSVVPRARPGYAAITQIAAACNVTVERLADIMAEDGVASRIGVPESMRFGSNSADGYSPLQQEEIERVLDERGLLRVMEPTDVNAKALPGHLPRYSERQIKIARSALDGTSGFGTWHLARTTIGVRAKVYTAEQVAGLEAWLAANYPEGKRT